MSPAPFEAVENAVAGLDGHAIVLVLGVYDAQQYAAVWSGVSTAPSRHHVGEWRAYYEERGLERFVDAAVVFCRHPRTRGCVLLGLRGVWVKARMSISERFGRRIETGASDLALKRLRQKACSVVSGSTLNIALTRHEREWQMGSTHLVWTGGLPVDASISPETAKVLTACDGEAALEAVTDRVFAELGIFPDPMVFSEVQWLVRCGFVEVRDRS